MFIVNHTNAKAYHVKHKYFILLMYIMHHIEEEAIIEEETTDNDVTSKPDNIAPLTETQGRLLSIISLC